MPKQRRLQFRLPELWHQSRSFFWLTISLAISHLLYVVDGLMGLSHNYTSLVFELLFTLLPPSVWMLLHLVSALAIFVGMYNNKNLVRFGYFVSVSTYWMITASFILSFIEKPQSLYALSPTFLCAVVSAAGFIELTRWKDV